MDLGTLIEPLLNQGPIGIAVVALGFAVKKLFQENAQLQRDKLELQRQQAEALANLHTHYQELLDQQDQRMLEEREKRVTEQKDATRAVSDSNAALKETVDALLSMRSSRPPQQSSRRD